METLFIFPIVAVIVVAAIAVVRWDVKTSAKGPDLSMDSKTLARAKRRMLTQINKSENPYALYMVNTAWGRLKPDGVKDKLDWRPANNGQVAPSQVAVYCTYALKYGDTRIPVKPRNVFETIDAMPFAKSVKQSIMNYVIAHSHELMQDMLHREIRTARGFSESSDIPYLRSLNQTQETTI